MGSFSPATAIFVLGVAWSVVKLVHSGEFSSVFERGDQNYFVVDMILYNFTVVDHITNHFQITELDVARAPDAGNCLQPLGMEHGHISDDKITASSAFDHKSVGPQNGR